MSMPEGTKVFSVGVDGQFDVYVLALSAEDILGELKGEELVKLSAVDVEVIAYNLVGCECEEIRPIWVNPRYVKFVREFAPFLRWRGEDRPAGMTAIDSGYRHG